MFSIKWRINKEDLSVGKNSDFRMYKNYLVAFDMNKLILFDVDRGKPYRTVSFLDPVDVYDGFQECSNDIRDEYDHIVDIHIYCDSIYILIQCGTLYRLTIKDGLVIDEVMNEEIILRDFNLENKYEIYVKKVVFDNNLITSLMNYYIDTSGDGNGKNQYAIVQYDIIDKKERVIHLGNTDILDFIISADKTVLYFVSNQNVLKKESARLFGVDIENQKILLNQNVSFDINNKLLIDNECIYIVDTYELSYKQYIISGGKTNDTIK